jgi:predicted transcriptional regulator
MELHLKPETWSRLQELAAQTGRSPDELVEDAMAGYLQEMAAAREALDRRFDEIESGKVQAVDGEDFFQELGRRGELKKRRTSQ